MLLGCTPAGAPLTTAVAASRPATVSGSSEDTDQQCGHTEVSEGFVSHCGAVPFRHRVCRLTATVSCGRSSTSWRDCRWAKSIAAKRALKSRLPSLAPARVADDGVFHDMSASRNANVARQPNLRGTSPTRDFPIAGPSECEQRHQRGSLPLDHVPSSGVAGLIAPSRIRRDMSFLKHRTARSFVQGCVVAGWHDLRLCVRTVGDLVR